MSLLEKVRIVDGGDISIRHIALESFYNRRSKESIVFVPYSINLQLVLSQIYLPFKV